MGAYNEECGMGMGSGRKSYRSLKWEFAMALLAFTATRTPLLQPAIFLPISIG